MTTTATPHPAILDDPACSTWLRQALTSALDRDPVDAANDAELLYQLLDRRAEDVNRRAIANAPDVCIECYSTYPEPHATTCQRVTRRGPR